MELIVILLGELLFAPFIAALTVVLELIAILIGGILDLIGARIAANKPDVKTPRRWSRILLLSAASLALVTFGILLAMNLFWFEGTVAWAALLRSMVGALSRKYGSGTSELAMDHRRASVTRQCLVPPLR